MAGGPTGPPDTGSQAAQSAPAHDAGPPKAMNAAARAPCGAWRRSRLRSPTRSKQNRMCRISTSSLQYQPQTVTDSSNFPASVVADFDRKHQWHFEGNANPIVKKLS